MFIQKAEKIKFEDLKAEINNYEQGNIDLIRKSSQLTFKAVDKKVILKGKSEIEISELAKSQLLTSVGIPKKTLSVISPRLQADMFNEVVRHRNFYDETFLRFRKTENRIILRSVHSTKYQPYNHNRLLDDFQTSLGSELNNLIITNYKIDDNKFNVRFSGLENLGDDNDKLFNCFNLSNSETGLGSIELVGGIFRLVCSNGLMKLQSGDEIARKHIGLHNLSNFFKQSVLNIQNLSTKRVEKFVASKDIKVNPNILIDKYFPEKEKRIQPFLTDRLKEQFEKSLSIELNQQNLKLKDCRLYDAVNAFTRAAKEYNPEHRLQIETFAASLLLTA